MSWKWPSLKLRDEPSPMQGSEFRRQKQDNWNALRSWRLQVFGLLAKVFESYDSKLTNYDHIMADYDRRFNNQIAQSTNDDEIVDARMPKNATSAYATLGERLDNGMYSQTEIDLALKYKQIKQGMLQDYNVPGVAGTLQSFADQIATDQYFKILLLTDVHCGKGKNDQKTFDLYPYKDYVDAPPLAIQQLENMTAFDTIVDCAVLNGDNAHGNEGLAMNEKRNQKVLTIARDALANTDLFVSIGNHDDGSVWWKTKSTAINRDQMLSIYDYDDYNFGEVRKDFCAYKDYENAKIRIITIAGFDNPEIYQDDGTIKYPRGDYSVFTQQQLTFIATALAAPDDYTIMIFNHAPLQGYFDSDSSNKFSVNHDLLEGMLEACANKTVFSGSGTNADYPAEITVDYSNNTTHLAGIVFGHQHRDKNMIKYNGVPAVERTAFVACDRGESTEKTYTTQNDLGTIGQYAFDVIEIDTTNQKVIFKRFGKGDDYSYDY